jgi:hypothetical protein
MSVQIDQLTAPTYEQLRPYKQPRSGRFPVYHDLVDRLVEVQDHPDEGLAFVMAVCSSYATPTPPRWRR